MHTKRLMTGLGLFALSSSVAYAQSLGTYGNTGLIDMPTANSFSDRSVAVSLTNTGNTDRVVMNFQLTPRVEISYGYASVNAFGTGAAASDTSQFDLKINLLEETDTLPALAIGIRDAIGSASYSSEYLVATKSMSSGLSVTGGIGWGRLASNDAFDNPFGGTRSNAPGGRERINGENFFRGDDIGVFGGLEYAGQGGWRFKVEYSSDEYEQEVAGGGFDRASPWNLGIEKSLTQGVDAGLYLIGGEEIGFRLSFVADPLKPRAPQDLLPGPSPVVKRPATAKNGTNWAQNDEVIAKLMGGVSEVLAAEGILVERAKITGKTAALSIDNTKMSRPTKAVGRTARILSAGMPPSVDTFRITLLESGLPTSTVTIDRAELERLADTHEAVPESWRRFTIANAKTITDPNYTRDIYPDFTYALSPRVPFGLYGSGLDFDIQIVAEARYQISPNFSLSGSVSQSLIGLDGSVPAPTAGLPQVRSNATAYSSTRPTLEYLTGDYVTRLGDALYGRATFGYLERMYGGFSGELLYKHVDAPLGYGLELNYAMQRDPDDFAGFDDYDVVTGHGSVYWDTGWNGVHAQVDAGRYLAGDWGATLTLSRRFANGWEVAGYATATDADLPGNIDQFDKGMRLTIPLQWSLPWPTRQKISVPFSDFTRDDGARLYVQNRLYDRVRETDRNALGQNWGAFWQ